MASLQWIGKEAVVGHHREVPYHLLRGDPALSVGEDGGVGSGNLLVQGDNLLALKALLPYYAGRVKCIYIDPPYNTGNEGWVYNDNTNSPEIRQWIGKVVGKEGETLDRHDRWLCMMYPRLALLKEFLTEDGAIFVSIDDNEVAHCRLILEHVFGPRNFITNLVWWKRVSPANDAQMFSSDHDHILVFAKRADLWRPNRLEHNEEQRKYYTNPDEDPRGPWNSGAYTCAKTAEERPNLYYAVVNPNTGEKIWPSKKRVWAYDPETHKQNVANGLLWWGKEGTGKMPRIKKFLAGARPVVPRSIWSYEEAGHNQEAKLEALSLLPGVEYFATPKPTRLIQRVLQVAADKDSLIMDSFAGSGTTGHAVLAMNKADVGNRRFICIEMDPTIATTITAQRLRKVAEGYHPQGDAKKEKVEGTGGGFRYVTLGEPLFNERGQVRAEVKFAELAAHVFFTETGEPLPKKVNGKRSPLIGVCRGTAYYLLFNGILGDKRPDGGNVLTGDVLAELPKHDGPRVVFGEACRLGAARLKREGVTFRQIPYQIKVS